MQGKGMTFLLQSVTCDEDNGRRHPKCEGYVTDTPDGRDYDCGYQTTITCDDCKHNNQPFGRKDPEAACNQ